MPNCRVQIMVSGSGFPLLLLSSLRGGAMMFTTKIDWEFDYNQGERYWK